MIIKKLFGTRKNGVRVFIYRITNRFGEYVEILDYGAAVHSVCVRDASGDIGDVVLGVPYADALDDFNLEGVIVGRCAGRIADAKFVLNGKEYKLDAGRGGHCLHSGSGNYGMRMFEVCADETDNSIILTCHDNGEGGFESEADVMIRYQFGDDSVLHLEYRIVPTQDTVIAPTSHIYFNLGLGDAREQILQIPASRYAGKDSRGLPDGSVCSVEGTPFDFRKAVTLREAAGRDIEGKFLGEHASYDDILLPDGEGYREAAHLFNAGTGRRMTVYTDMPAVVLFTFGADREIPGKYGENYHGFRSVCLETGHVPNAVNCPQLPSPVCRGGELFYSHTAYAFSAEPLSGEK